MQLLLFPGVTSIAEGTGGKVKFLSGAAMYTISAETPRSAENVSVNRRAPHSTEALATIPFYDIPLPKS